VRQSNPSGSSLVERLRPIGGGCCPAPPGSPVTPREVGCFTWPPELLTPKRDGRAAGGRPFMNPGALSPVGLRPGSTCTAVRAPAGPQPAAPAGAVVQVIDDFLRAPCAVREG
jgi:hypothetical protein